MFVGAASETAKFPIKWQKADGLAHKKCQATKKTLLSDFAAAYLWQDVPTNLKQNSSQITNKFLPIRQASNEGTPASISCYVLPPILINL